MSIFSLAKKKDELVLVFDIGSSSVKAALFYMQVSGIPRVVFSVREPIIIEDKISIERFLELTTKALNTVAEKIYKKGLGAPNRVFCVLYSPWHISQTRVISLKKETSFTFTSKLADALIQKEIELIKNEYLQKYDHVANTLRMVELKNIKITLNGYEVDDPLNKKTKELEMTVFITLSEEQVCKKIEETIGKYFNPRGNHGLIKFSSFNMVSFTVIRDLYALQDSFLLINVGGEITDISMVKKNALRESTSFPLGTNFMIRKISSEMNCTLSEAKSLVSLFKDGHAALSAQSTLEPAIIKLKTEWLKNFQDSLANLSNDISIPAFIYITVDKDLAEFFSEIIKTEQFNQYTLTESKFQIIFLNVDNLHNIVVFEKESIFNAYLTLDCVYINRFF